MKRSATSRKRKKKKEIIKKEGVKKSLIKEEIWVMFKKIYSIGSSTKRNFKYVPYITDCGKTKGDNFQHMEIFFPSEGFSCTSYIGEGVIFKPKKETEYVTTEKSYWRKYILTVPRKEYKRVLFFCNEKRMKSYDKSAIFLGIFSENIVRIFDKNDSYTCSSLVMKSLCQSEVIKNSLRDCSEDFRIWGSDTFFSSTRPPEALEIMELLLGEFNYKKSFYYKKENFKEKPKKTGEPKIYLKLVDNVSKKIEDLNYASSRGGRGKEDIKKKILEQRKIEYDQNDQSMSQSDCEEEI